MAHLTAHAARPFSMHGVTFTSFASSASGAASLAAWRADFQPRTPGQAHSMSQEEILYVIAGELEVSIDDVIAVVHAGDAVLVPAGGLLRVSNDTDRPATAWVTTVLGMTATMEQGGDRFAPPWAQ